MKRIFPRLLANDSIKNLCGTDILRGKASHAYIIDGPTGSGKHTAAMEIASAILCEKRERDGIPLPCGECPSCKKIEAGFSTCIEILNRGSAATLQVESIRNMLSGISYLPEDGDYRIYIIEEAEKMTTAAQNALLLSLEEPPAHAVFILLTTDSGALLETIRSRAHILKTELLSSKFIFEQLSDMMHSGIIPKSDESKLRTAASASSGSLGLAITLCDPSSDSPVIKQMETASELCHNLLFAGSAEAIIFSRNLSLTRADCEAVLYYAMVNIRDLIALKSGSDHTMLQTDSDGSQNNSAKTTVSKLYYIYSLLETAQNDICKRNASISTVFSSLAANAWKDAKAAK